MNQNLLEIRNLRVSFETHRGMIPAVDGVSLSVPRGKTVALVGESGCGKSTAALSILKLIPQPPGRFEGGQILFHDHIHTGETLAGPDVSGPVAPEIPEAHDTLTSAIDLLHLDEREMQKVRGGKIAMIFQEPLTSLNPVFTVGEQIVEAIELHQPLRGAKAWNKAIEMLDRVGIDHPHQRAMDYPHQLSGGMRQRVMIAMALSCEPDLLICDEPTTALDVTIQAQILELLRSLQQERGMSILFITHDLGVVAQMADEVYVMYAGKIVEHAPVVDLFDHPLHPYTQGLLRCTPQVSLKPRPLQQNTKNRLEVIPGRVPDLTALPSGCRFHPRCDLTSQKAAEAGRSTISISADPDRPNFSSLTGPQTASKPVQFTVLNHCVNSVESEPSGIPQLEQVRPDHFVACWEM